jgi:membrane-bound metal-dependent hydrolase YbcI (DUF457 family)
MTAVARRQIWLDGLAAGASLICLVHCLVLPMLIAALPLLGAVLNVPESFHRYALALAIPASTGALALGYRRHRATLPTLPGAAGLVLLMLGAFAAGTPAAETALTVAGSLFVAGAHLLNWRLAPRGGKHR